MLKVLLLCHTHESIGSCETIMIFFRKNTKTTMRQTLTADYESLVYIAMYKGLRLVVNVHVQPIAPTSYDCTEREFSDIMIPAARYPFTG
jgi:hypothetical protein